MKDISAFGWAAMAAFCWGFAPVLEKTGLRGSVDPIIGVIVRTLGVLIGALLFIPLVPRITGHFSDLTPATGSSCASGASWPASSDSSAFIGR